MSIGTKLDYRMVNYALQGVWTLGSVYLRRRRPFILNHLITVRCNLACPFCYVSGPEQREFNRVRYPKKSEMSTAEVREFYEQLIARGFKLAVIVGGEPLLRTDLDDLLQVLKGRIYPTVFTNGYLLAERADLLRKAGTVFVSLDAPDQQHDELRAREGCFERAIAGIDTLRAEYPGVTIALMMTVTDQNLHRVGDMLAFAREMRLPIGFQPPTYDGQFALDDRPTAEASQRTPHADAVADAFRVIQDAADRQRVCGSRAFFDLVIEDKKTYRCHYPAYVLGPVLPNGDVVGCTDSAVIANVREQRVAEILGGEAYRANADAGPTCPRGCRDWGIYDISAVHNLDFGIGDIRRYYRAFLGGRQRSGTRQERATL